VEPSDTIPACDTHTHIDTGIAITHANIASCGQNAIVLQYDMNNIQLTKDCVTSSSVGCFSPRLAPDFVMQSSRF